MGSIWSVEASRGDVSFVAAYGLFIGGHFKRNKQ